MKGARPIQWIYDWLGQGSVGEPYEVLPLVQPVVDVNGIEMPIQYGQQEFAVAAAVGSVIVNLAPPNANTSRILFSVWVARTVPVGTDREDLLRVVNGKLCFLASQEIGMLGLANIFNPLVGGFKRYGGFGATPLQITGRGPVISTADAPVQVQIVTAAAVGNANVAIIYADVPARSVIPAEFLL